LHTGDIGCWIPGGRLKIIDRKKNIFKLAQGEYIAPEKIENVYTRSQFVSQCFIYEIMELLFRDYRAFDQRLWSFCSEIVELFLRDLLQLHVDFLI
jgi:hypothetical protein